MIFASESCSIFASESCQRASHALRELLVFIILTILLMSNCYPKVLRCEVNVPADQLGMFYTGRSASVVNYEVFMVPTRIASYKSESIISYSKKISMLLRLSKLALLAELNVSVCLLFCGDIEQNPGPDELNSFDLPRKGLRFGQWNVNYLTENKFEEIKMHMIHSNGERRLDILVLTDTFFNNRTVQELYHVPGFDLFRRDRKTSSGGGILMYVNNEPIVLNVKQSRSQSMSVRGLGSAGPFLRIFPLGGHFLKRDLSVR